MSDSNEDMTCREILARLAPRLEEARGKSIKIYNAREIALAMLHVTQSFMREDALRLFPDTKRPRDILSNLGTAVSALVNFTNERTAEAAEKKNDAKTLDQLSQEIVTYKLAQNTDLFEKIFLYGMAMGYTLAAKEELR
jgi:hypothetical protein